MKFQWGVRFGIPVLLAGTTLVSSWRFPLPYETPKVLFFRIAAAVIFFIWGVAVLRDQKISLPRVSPTIGWTLLAVIMANAVSFLVSYDRGQSFFGSPFRFQGVYTFLHYGMLLVLVLAACGKKDWGFFEKLLAVVALVLGLTSFWQYFFTDNGYFYGRPIATLGNPVYVGQLLALLAPVLLTAALVRRRVWFWWLAVGISATTIFLSGSRGSILGLLAGGVVYACGGAWILKKNGSRGLRAQPWRWA